LLVNQNNFTKWKNPSIHQDWYIMQGLVYLLYSF